MNSYTVTALESGGKIITILDGRSTIHSSIGKIKEDLSDILESSVIIDAIFINGMGNKRFVDINGDIIPVDDKIRKKADDVINFDTREKFQNLLRNKR